MSTRYFLVCLTCQEKISIADRSFHGRALTPAAKRDLPEFSMKHVTHDLKILSEYDFDDIQVECQTSEALITKEDISKLEKTLIEQDDEYISGIMNNLLESEPILYEWVSHHFALPSATRNKMYAITLGVMMLLTEKGRKKSSKI